MATLISQKQFSQNAPNPHIHGATGNDKKGIYDA